MSNPSKQQGAAIIVALFVVALVAAAATIMIERLRIDLRRTELILNANKTYLYAQGSIAWAIDQLNTNFQKQQKDKVVDRTPLKSPPTRLDGLTIASTTYDAQGYFNINNLSDQAYQEIFLRLIRIVSPETDSIIAKNIMLAIVDWISPGSQNPQLDEYYLKLSKPYRAPHRPMASASEIRLVKDMTQSLYAKLFPFIIALPNVTPININNAEIPVLMSLSATMNLEAAKAIQVTAKQNPFPTIEAFTQFDIVKNHPIEANKITTISNYFLAVTNVTLGNQISTLYTLLERVPNGPKTKTHILWQSKGSL
jgi:general secretion pathway protein K